MGFLVPAHAIETTVADRHWIRSVYLSPPAALAEVEMPRGSYVEVSPMRHYYGLWMRTVNADHLTWRIHTTLWAQTAAGMILSEASGRVQSPKLCWRSERLVIWTRTVGVLPSATPSWPGRGARAPTELNPVRALVPDRETPSDPEGSIAKTRLYSRRAIGCFRTVNRMPPRSGVLLARRRGGCQGPGPSHPP